MSVETCQLLGPASHPGLMQSRSPAAIDYRWSRRARTQETKTAASAVVARDRDVALMLDGERNLGPSCSSAPRVADQPTAA